MMRKTLVVTALIALAGCKAASPTEKQADPVASVTPAITPTFNPPAAPLQTGNRGDSVTQRWVANGNEPFWTARVENDKLTYITPDAMKGRVIPVERQAFAKGVDFAGSLDGQDLVLTIKGGDCADDMSGAKYEFTAILQIGTKTMRGCARDADQPAPPPA